MGDISANFSRYERQCKCWRHSKEEYEIDRPTLLNMLEQLRVYYGKPVEVNSWCRCPPHNDDEGGVDSSSHVHGWAVDISAPTSTDKFRLLRAAIQAGFTRIGVGQGFIHIDADPVKPQEVSWVYT